MFTDTRHAGTTAQMKCQGDGVIENISRLSVSWKENERNAWIHGDAPKH